MKAKDTDIYCVLYSYPIKRRLRHVQQLRVGDRKMCGRRDHTCGRVRAVEHVVEAVGERARTLPLGALKAEHPAGAGEQCAENSREQDSEEHDSER